MLYFSTSCDSQVLVNRNFFCLFYWFWLSFRQFFTISYSTVSTYVMYYFILPFYIFYLAFLYIPWVLVYGNWTLRGHFFFSFCSHNRYIVFDSLFFIIFACEFLVNIPQFSTAIMCPIISFQSKIFQLSISFYCICIGIYNSSYSIEEFLARFILLGLVLVSFFVFCSLYCFIRGSLN